MQVIITAERAIIPQNALGRPEHTDFVDRLLATIREAHQARLRLEELSGDEASLESGGRPCSTALMKPGLGWLRAGSAMPALGL